MGPGRSSKWGMILYFIWYRISPDEPQVLGSPYCSRLLVCFIRTRPTERLHTIKHKSNTESNKVTPFACRPVLDTAFNA